MPTVPLDFRNVLLRRLPSEDLALLEPHLEPFRLGRHAPLFARGEPVGHVFFPDRGVASTVMVSPEGQRVEAGVVGFEGFTPTGVVMGADTLPFDGNMQMGGEGHRIAIAPLRAATAESAGLRDLLIRFAYVFSVQLGSTALSNAVHTVDERLARWLLMCHDRADGDELELTHDFMSLMLAVRRPSVTTALHVLEGNGYIRAERGLLTIRDRAGLESFAGDAYGVPEREYRQLIGPMR